MKKPQDHKAKQTKPINKEVTQHEYLELLKSIRQEKDLDQLQELIKSIFSTYGLTTDEVAALLFSLMRTTLQELHNRRMLVDKFNIDIDSLEADGVLQVQRALLDAYQVKVAQ